MDFDVTRSTLISITIYIPSNFVLKGVFTTVEKVFEEQVLEPKLHELTRPCPCPKESVPTDKKLNLPKPAAVPRYMTEKHPQNVGFYNAPTSYQMDFKAYVFTVSVNFKSYKIILNKN